MFPAGRGGTVRYKEVNHCLWIPPLTGHLLQVPGSSSRGRGQRLVVSGAEPKARQTEVGASDSYIEQGGSGFPDIGKYLIGGGAIVHYVRVRDMGPGAANEEGVGRIPPQGGPQADGVTTAEGKGLRLGLLPAGRFDGGGGFAGGGYLRLPTP